MLALITLSYPTLKLFERAQLQISGDTRIEVNRFTILFLQELDMNSQNLPLISPFLEAGAVISLDKHQWDNAVLQPLGLQEQKRQEA